MYRQNEVREVASKVEQELPLSSELATGDGSLRSVCRECLVGAVFGGLALFLIYVLLFTGIVYAL